MIIQKALHILIKQIRKCVTKAIFSYDLRDV